MVACGSQRVDEEEGSDHAHEDRDDDERVVRAAAREVPADRIVPEIPLSARISGWSGVRRAGFSAYLIARDAAREHTPTPTKRRLTVT